MSSILPYFPSYEEYRERRAKLLESDTEKDLGSPPEGFPREKIVSPLAWKASEVEEIKEKWTYRLSDNDLKSIDAAVLEVQAQGLPLQSLSPDNFPLSPTLIRCLNNMSDSLYNGVGFGLLQGINPQNYTLEQNITIETGLTSYFGRLRAYHSPTNIADNVLSHIRDLKTFFPDDNLISPSHTNKAMTFHTDLGDIVSIYTVDRGAAGGSFSLASSWNVYNTLAENRPDILRVLSDPFVFDSHHPDVPSYEKPLLHFHDGRVMLQSFRRPFAGFGEIKRSLDLPPLTDVQMDALDELHFTAQAESFKIDFENGDLLLFNNLALLHARDAYAASSEEEGLESERHLLKMIVRNEAVGWPIPDIMEDQWVALYAPRGDPRKELFPMTYPTRGQVPNTGWCQNG